MKREAKIAGAGPLSDFEVGHRVMTREGYPGTVTDIHEGPADLTTIWVELDNGMGGGEYAEAEIQHLPGQAQAASQAAIVEAGVEHTAADDYPELGSILSDRLPPQITRRIAARTDSSPYLLVYVDHSRGRQVEGFGDWEAANARGQEVMVDGGTVPNALPSEVAEEYPHREYSAGIWDGSNLWGVILGWAEGYTAARGGANPFVREAASYDGQDLSGTCEVCGKAIVLKRGSLTHADGSNDHAVEPSSDSNAPIGVTAGSAFLGKESIYLPPVPKSEQRASTTDVPESQRPGYDEGFEHGKAGVTRDPSQPEDPEFMAGYDMGWAEGVLVLREPANSWDAAPSSDQHAGLAPGISPVAGMETEAGKYWDWVKSADPKAPHSFDWCRFRRDSHCYFSGVIDEPASYQMGYAVYVPKHQGRCYLDSWKDQEMKCSASQPGPNVRNGYTDATEPFSSGGQRNGEATDMTAPVQIAPPGTHRPDGVHAIKRQASRIDASSLSSEALAQVSAAFEFTAAWSDIRAKAKRIRESGGVRVVAAQDNVVVAHVKGDTAVYETEIVSMIGKRNVASWACGCKWSSYSWGRSGPWKKFEGRMCAHALALQYEAQSKGFGGKEISLDSKQPSWMKGQTPQSHTPARQLTSGLRLSEGAVHLAGPIDDHLRQKLRSSRTLEQAAQAMMALARREEPGVLRDMEMLAAQNHGELVGLQHRIKGEGSLLRKMRQEAPLFGNSPGKTAMNMSDTLRFTMLFTPDRYTQEVKETLDALQRKGYKTRTKNYWGRGDSYNGVNVALTTPGGHPVELQFHTEESFRVKSEEVHPLYEQWRTETDPNKKAIIGYEMRNRFDAVPRPAGALSIEQRKKQPFVPYKDIDWFRRAASSTPRYLAVIDNDGDDSTVDPVVAVLRVTDSYVEACTGDGWFDAPDLARFTFMGEPASEEIDEGEALSLIEGLMA